MSVKVIWVNGSSCFKDPDHQEEHLLLPASHWLPQHPRVPSQIESLQKGLAQVAPLRALTLQVPPPNPP